MSDLSLGLSDLAVLTQPFGSTLVYALWYAALLWLPVRGLAALVDHCRGVAVPDLDGDEMAAGDDCYRIGMDVLPPM